MTHRMMFAVLCLCSLILVSQKASSVPATASMSKAGPKPMVASWGVSLAGAEFGVEQAGFSNQSPGVFGRDYTYNTERTVQYFCEKGGKILRVPIRWERIQPRLGEELDQLELARLRVLVGWARKHGGNVLIDLHNYGRYTAFKDGKPHSCIIDQKVQGRVIVSREHFADLWRRMAIAFRDESTISGFGLMNEPHDMGGSNWPEISQAAVDSIRATGDTRLILVAGNDWSKTHHFTNANGPKAWISDPADNIAYEAHCYFDRDGSGRYELSYERELAIDPNLEQRGVERLSVFTNWCEQNQVRGFIGEYAVPQNDVRWHSSLAKFQAAMHRAGIVGCYWAGGEWWGNYALSVQPTANFTEDARVLSVLMK